MNFRDGLFAASLATQVPILDIVVVEATPGVPETIVDIKMWTPAKSEPFKGTLDSYAAWRLQNKTAIKAFTRACQDSFFNTLTALEDSRASCGLVEDVCPVNPSIDAALKRNNAVANVYV
jgi:hypothetical protein